MRLPFGWAWLKGNWRWFLPALLAFQAAIWLLVHQVLLRSDAFAMAERFARTNAQVAAHIGEVQSVELPWLNSGAIRVSGDGGEAHFTLRMQGSVRQAELFVELRKRGVWELRFARLMKGSESHVLLDASPGEACQASEPPPSCEPSL